MGLLSFLFPQTEERLHRHLSEILADYHKIRAVVEAERSLGEQLRHIHSRIDTINAGIRHANSIQNRSQRLAVLHQLVESERQMLSVQKMLASELLKRAGKVIQFERKTEQAAKRIRAA